MEAFFMWLLAVFFGFVGVTVIAWFLLVVFMTLFGIFTYKIVMALVRALC